MTAIEVFQNYVRKGYQNFIPTNKDWAQKWLDSNPEWKTKSDTEQAVVVFKDWVEDNNAYDANSNMIG